MMTAQHGSLREFIAKSLCQIGLHRPFTPPFLPSFATLLSSALLAPLLPLAPLTYDDGAALGGSGDD